MRLIDDQRLDSLSEAAVASPRRRQNFNYHQDLEEPCQRLLSAMEPDSYVRPHRHLTPLKPEAFLALRGRFAVLEFDDHGQLLEVALIGPQEPAKGADIAAGAWHAVIALDPGSVFFEAKPGPYHPLSDKDWAPWSPAEGSPDAPAFLRQQRRAVLAFLGLQGEEQG